MEWINHGTMRYFHNGISVTYFVCCISTSKCHYKTQDFYHISHCKINKNTSPLKVHFVYVALQQSSWTYWQLVAWSIIFMQNHEKVFRDGCHCRSDILNIFMCKFSKFFTYIKFFAYFTQKLNLHYVWFTHSHVVFKPAFLSFYCRTKYLKKIRMLVPRTKK